MASPDWASIDRENQRRYRPATTRSRVAMIGVSVATGAIVLELVQIMRGFAFADRFGVVTLAEFSAWQRNLNTSNGIYIVAIVAAAIAFFAWLSRVVDNIPALTGEDAWVTPRWSIALWFVPIASFVAPYRIVADAWRRLAAHPGQRATAIVVTWWVLWLGGGIAFRFLDATTRPAETSAELRSYLTRVIVAGCAQVIAGVILVLIIREIERRSRARAAANDAAAAAAASTSIANPIPESPELPSIG